MAKYLYETHLHTSETSACAGSSAKEHVLNLYNEGYSGMIVTDHFVNGNSVVDISQPWVKQINLFCKGYDEAVEAAKNLDFDVFFGLEYSYKATEFITIGIDKQFFLDHPDLVEWKPEQYFDKVHEAGGFLIHAHPFRMRPYIKKIRLYTEYIDAVEIENLGNDKPEFNQQALEYARKYNLPMTKGSDLHFVKYFNHGGMVFDTRPKDIFELIELIKQTRY